MCILSRAGSSHKSDFMSSLDFSSGA